MATKASSKIKKKKSRKPNRKEVDYISEVLSTLQEDIETIRNYNKNNPWTEVDLEQRDDAYSLWAKTCKTKKELIETYALLSGIVTYYNEAQEKSEKTFTKGFGKASGTQNAIRFIQEEGEEAFIEAMINEAQ